MAAVGGRVGDRWHSSSAGLVRSPTLLGDHLVAELRERGRASENDMAAARTGQFLNKKLGTFQHERRILLGLADSARVILLLQRTIDSVLGMTDQLKTEIREIWFQNLESERSEWIHEIEKVLDADAQMRVEMGGQQQRLQVLVLLKHLLDHYSHVLSARELDVVSRVFDTVARRGNVMVGRLPSWFATSELEWFRAKTTVVAGGEEACERQASIWAKLHHPNIRKFFGACHVGNAFVIHEACSELPLTTQNVPRRRRRKTRGERALDKKLMKTGARAVGQATQTWRHLLGCALGLQYVHDRGLVHEKLSVGHLLYSQSSQKGVLSGMGLVRQRVKFHEETQEHNARISASSDILALGLAVLMILVRDRSADCDTTFDRLPDARPDFIKKTEWELLEGMCAPDPANRISVADIVHQMSVFAKRNSQPQVVSAPSNTLAVIEDVRDFKIQTLGMTLEATLEEIDGFCAGKETFAFGDLNRLVYTG